MNSAQRVIEKFGGQSNLASLLGKTPSTVQYWAKAGVIPARWHGKILSLARSHGIELYPSDFIENGTELQQENNDVEALPIARWSGTLVLGAQNCLFLY